MAPRKPADPKHEELRLRGLLHAHPDEVTDPLFVQAGSDFFDRHDLLQVKYEMLRRVRVDGQPVARVARAFGFSRQSFYQAQRAFGVAGLAGLLPEKRGPRAAHKLSAPVVEFLQQQRAADPTVTAIVLAQRVRRRFRISVHSRSVERALARAERPP